MRSEKSLFEETTVDRLQFFWALAGVILILNGACSRAAMAGRAGQPSTAA
jgi:hypothetical protein